VRGHAELGYWLVEGLVSRRSDVWIRITTGLGRSGYRTAWPATTSRSAYHHPRRDAFDAMISERAYRRAAPSKRRSRSCGLQAGRNSTRASWPALDAISPRFPDARGDGLMVLSWASSPA